MYAFFTEYLLSIFLLFRQYLNWQYMQDLASSMGTHDVSLNELSNNCSNYFD